MSSYPDDFYTEARIDVDDIADYVAENWEYFSERCNPNGSKKLAIQEIVNMMDNVLYIKDDIRRLRDFSHEFDNDPEVLMYNEYLKIRDELAKLAY